MELLSPLFDARAEYLDAAFETIEQTWGTTDRYLSDGLGTVPARPASGCATAWSTTRPYG